MITRNKRRFDDENAMQGTDCYIFEIICKRDVSELEDVELINEHGRSYGTIKSERGKLLLYLVLPRYIRQNNIIPFDSWDACDKRVYKEICGQLRLVLGTDFESKLRSVECNITKRVCCFASTSDVLNLLNHALLSPKDDNLEYSGQSKVCALKKEIHTVISRKAHYYTLKAYDKTVEYRKKCKEQGGKEDDIEDNMLRIEIVLLGRTIDKLFGDKTSVYDILTEDSLIKVLYEYKRIYTNEIINKRVKPYLSQCQQRLVHSLLRTNSIIATVAIEREIIPDKEVLRRAIKEWQELKGVSPHAARDMKRYEKRMNLPYGVIRTLKEFRIACG